MGIIISRFRRKKTTIEVLDRLETEIKSIERDGEYKQQTQKRIMGYMMAYSIGFCVLFGVLYYFMYVGKSQHWLHSMLNASPLLVLPILVVFLRSAISWYYDWLLNKNRAKLTKMRAEKKKLLEDVMNTETYKDLIIADPEIFPAFVNPCMNGEDIQIPAVIRPVVAKEILDKYGSPEEQSKTLKPFTPTISVAGSAPGTPVPASVSNLRQRQIMMQTSTPIQNNNKMLAITNTPMALYKGARLRSDQLPRPLLDKNRSALDKVVDYILRDGPNHRMALICTECYSHNGMAMVEEFDYVSYVCAYCGSMNPARKKRPMAPLLSSQPLPYATPMKCITDGDGGGDDDSPVISSASDSEDEKVMNNVSQNEGSEGESDRPPSPKEETLKSDHEKKED